MAALVILPQRFLYSIAVAGASIRGAFLGSACRPHRPLDAGPARHPDRRALDSSPAHAISDESGGWYRLARGIVHGDRLRSRPLPALLLAAAARRCCGRPLTGPSAQAVPPALHEANSYLDAHYSRGINSPVTDHHRRPHGPSRDGRLPPPDPGDRAECSGAPFSAPRSGGARQLRPCRPSAFGCLQASVGTIRQFLPPAATRALVSGNTAGFIDQKQSLVEHLPLLVTIICDQRP